MLNYIQSLVILFAITFVFPLMARASIVPTYLRVEYKVNPFIDIHNPRLSWELTADGHNRFQSAYQIIVSSSEQNLKKHIGDVWDSGKVTSDQSNQITYTGKVLHPGQRVWWKVRTWDEKNRPGVWSEANHWEMAKPNHADWKAKWVGIDLNHLAKNGEYHLPPSPYIRKEATCNKKVKSARLYISSLGLHNFYINGEKVGKDYFASGWTDYNKRVYYNVYDVTSLVKLGKNAFGAILSDGWYAGYLGYALLVGTKQVNHFYGDYPMLKAQVDVIYEDGTKTCIVTDNSWKTGLGAIDESDLLEGETYDARKEPLNWNKVGFDDARWQAIQQFSDKTGQKLQLYPGNPVQIVKELPVKRITEIEKGKYIIDFGQNFAGNIRMSLKGKENDSVVFRYGEMLHQDGSLMRDNLRRARSTDTYVFRGDPIAEVWSPSFTFHGFQYVEVSGLKEKPNIDFLTGLVMSSAQEEVGAFESDNAMLNQLYSNIVWTQRANYFDIPTDCPQRDERLGWTGDAQVYMRSAIYNADVATFHTKWIRDLNDAQWPDGAFPIYAPMPTTANGIAAIRAEDRFSPGWSEAGIICTYEIFKGYNDLRIVKESLPYMLKYMDFLKRRTQDGILKEGAFDDGTPKGGFGDWLSVGMKTSPDLIATMYYFYSAKLMVEMCHAIGEDLYVNEFEAEMIAIREGFKKHYMDEGGRLKTNAAVYGDGKGYVEGTNGFSGHTQTAYANAIYSGILEGKDAEKAGVYLRQLVEKNDNKLSTGFLGFKPLLPSLSETGSTDKAFALMLSTEYPSLGYEVVNGATSIWERWDSYTKDKGFVHNAAMNSFSHYAFGSVNEWIFEYMLGIKAIDRGYKSFQIKPEIPSLDQDLHKAKVSFRSLSGNITSGWRKVGNTVYYEVVIPVNTTAICSFRAERAAEIYVNGTPLSQSKLILEKSRNKDSVAIKLGSGDYNVTVMQN